MISVEIVALIMTMVVPLGLFTMIYFIVKSENETKQKMIEAGLNPKSEKNNKIGSGALKTSGLLIGAGLGLFIATILTNFVSIENEEGIYFGLISLLGGIGLVVAHNIARKQYKEDNL